MHSAFFKHCSSTQLCIKEQRIECSVKAGMLDTALVFHDGSLIRRNLYLG